MKVTYDDKEYDFDLDEIDVRQATIIQDKCGMTLMGLEEGLADGNAHALRALFWIMLVQSGETVDIDRINFKIVKFAKALDKAAVDQAAAAEAKTKGKAESKASSPA